MMLVPWMARMKTDSSIPSGNSSIARMQSVRRSGMYLLCTAPPLASSRAMKASTMRLMTCAPGDFLLPDS